MVTNTAKVNIKMDSTIIRSFWPFALPVEVPIVPSCYLHFACFDVCETGCRFARYLLLVHLGAQSGAPAGATTSRGRSAIAAVLRKPSRDGIVTVRPKPQRGFGERSE
jgi:hypothetical protein